ncbi:MAG: phage tail tube protein [Hylemonella sp.]
MARAYGANASLLAAFETTYGSNPVGDYWKLPFVSTTLGSEQGLIANDLIGLGRDPSAPIRDVIKVEGDIVVPIDVRNIGMWLKALLGSATTTGTGTLTHTFISGKSSLPSISLETGLPDIPAWFVASGVMVNSLQVGFARSGAANATVGLIAQGETKQAVSLDTTPTTRDILRFNQFQGSIKKGGTALGNVVSAQLTYSNNLERIETIRSDGKIDGADPTVASLTGNLEVRFADTQLIDAATNNTPLELTFAYTIDATKRLTFIAHEVYLPKPKLSISGPGGIQATFEWQAAKNVAANKMLTVELLNDVTTY